MRVSGPGEVQRMVRNRRSRASSCGAWEATKIAIDELQRMTAYVVYANGSSSVRRSRP